jgi:hypothetical protein
MSKGGQIAIGVTFLIGGICMAACGFFVGNEVPAGPTPFYLGGAFCIVVAIACLVRRSQWVTIPLIIAGVLGYCFRDGPPEFSLGDFSGLALPAGIVFFVILGCYLFFRWKYRVSIRAVRMAQAGDIKGGIALLQEHLRTAGGSASLYNDLAALLGGNSEWAESLRMIEKAEQLGGTTTTSLATKGFVLWKLGRTEEALACLKQSVELGPKVLFHVCNYGSLLVETGRLDEATAMLGQAEHAYRTQISLGNAADREVRKNALEEFRRKLEDAKLRA